MRYWCLKNYIFLPKKHVCGNLWNIYGIKLKINNIKFVVETKKSSFFLYILYLRCKF